MDLLFGDGVWLIRDQELEQRVSLRGKVERAAASEDFTGPRIEETFAEGETHRGHSEKNREEPLENRDDFPPRCPYFIGVPPAGRYGLPFYGGRREEMRKHRKGVSRFAILPLAAMAALATGVGVARGQTEGSGAEAVADGIPMRWDIVKFTSFGPDVFAPGGSAAAKAASGAQIALTGTGTFLSTGDRVEGVTGGGTWIITGLPPTLGTPSGTYVVTELLGWQPAPGALPNTVTDTIAPSADARAGLLVLRVRYSDGVPGILSVSAPLPGTPAIVLPGVTATKDFADFYNAQPPVAGTDGNRAYVHVLTSGGAPACSPGATTLCLGGRFKVQASGPGITGSALPDTTETGDFWFYDPANIDVVVKVLDGRAINAHFWVFIGSLSDRPYTVTITDTATGTVKTYANPPGSVSDTSAF